jgi:hypothetical protein
MSNSYPILIPLKSTFNIMILFNRLIFCIVAYLIELDIIYLIEIVF